MYKEQNWYGSADKKTREEYEMERLGEIYLCAHRDIKGTGGEERTREAR